MKISIIGTGYVGLVSAVCLAEKGHHVICVDIDSSKVEKINRAVPTIFETGLEELLKRNVLNGHLVASLDLRAAVMETDISIISVGTPFNGTKIDLRYIKEAAEGIAKALKNKNRYHTVVVKSTVVPGTTDTVVLPILEKFSGKKAGEDFGVGVNPEFLREGRAVSDFMRPDRIIIGGIDKRTTDRLMEIYEVFRGVDILVVNNRTAEMVKYASNSLFATLISFSNEIGNACALTEGVDVKEVLAGVCLDKRLNPLLEDGNRVNPGFLSYLEAGCGFGGSCFPKDVKSFIEYTKSIGENPRLLKAVMEVNKDQPNRLICLLEKYYPSPKNLIVAVLGLAFKPGTDDMRESPAIPVIKTLLEKGAYVKAYDPVAKEEAKKIFGTKNIEYPEELKKTLSDVDAVILITKWDEFDDLKSLIKDQGEQLVIDGRRILNKHNYNKYEGIGLNHGK